MNSTTSKQSICQPIRYHYKSGIHQHLKKKATFSNFLAIFFQHMQFIFQQFGFKTVTQGSSYAKMRKNCDSPGHQKAPRLLRERCWASPRPGTRKRFLVNMRIKSKEEETKVGSEMDGEREFGDPRALSSPLKPWAPSRGWSGERASRAGRDLKSERRVEFARAT